MWKDYHARGRKEDEDSRSYMLHVIMSLCAVRGEIEGSGLEGDQEQIIRSLLSHRKES